jgi:MoaA/NifB/PqqE/SkfB family radical SAM enzyme
MAGLKNKAVQQMFKGGLHVVPLMSDKAFLSIFEGKIKSLPSEDSRDFVRKLLLSAKRAVASPRTKKAAITLFGNMVSEIFDAQEKRQAFREKYGFEPPNVMVVSPSMRCNLRCYGCYAGEYTKGDDLDPQLLERAVVEANEMGIFFITVSGGEPFFSQDVLNLWEKHRDIFFIVYTNGTLIDKDMARRLAEYGNVIPCISVEGYEEETDKRRGPGTYKKIMDAMDNLRDVGVPFGFSATVTRQNNELVTSDKFIDLYADKGCFIGWYFNYIPIGRKPDMDLMPTPEQRVARWERISSIRMSKSVVLADFWCDGSLTGGCIAGGRAYFHLNCNGDVEPCVFVHFAADNIKNKSLAEALNSPFFKGIRSRQPYSQNLLRPCMIIDNPEVLRDVVKEGKAYPTHTGAETIINDLSDELDKYAAKYASLSDPLWNKSMEAVKPAAVKK